MAEQLEFTVRLLTKEDFDIAVEFVHKHYTLKEPIREMVTKDVQQCFELDKDRIKTKLKDAASFGVFNNSGTMVASAFSGINTRCKKSLCCQGNFEKSSWYSNMSDFFGKMEDGLMDELNTDKFLMLSLLGVDSNYQRQGLAKMLVKRSEEAAVDLKCSYIVVDASSYYTQMLLEKCGYAKLRELKYVDSLPSSVDFKVILPHETCAVYYKQL